MIVNPEKFLAILLDKRNSDYFNENVTIDKDNIKIVSNIKMLIKF